MPQWMGYRKTDGIAPGYKADSSPLADDFYFLWHFRHTALPALLMTRKGGIAGSCTRWQVGHSTLPSYSLKSVHPFGIGRDVIARISNGIQHGNRVIVSQIRACHHRQRFRVDAVCRNRPVALHAIRAGATATGRFVDFVVLVACRSRIYRATHAA